MNVIALAVVVAAGYNAGAFVDVVVVVSADLIAVASVDFVVSDQAYFEFAVAAVTLDALAADASMAAEGLVAAKFEVVPISES